MALVQRPDGAWVDDDVPKVCANGHPLKPPNVEVGGFPCSCTGVSGRGRHTTWTCIDCGDVSYRPTHDPGSASDRIGAMH